MLPQKPITKPGEGKQREKYLSQERYLEERYQISVGLKGPKRLEDEEFEDYKLRMKAENGLLHEYLRGVWMTDGKCTALTPEPCINCT
jgi:hypothetical protein